MESEYIGIGILVLLVLVGAPMWVAFGLGGSLALVIGFDIEPELIASMIYNRLNNITLLAVPLFLLTGTLLGRGGAAGPIVRFLITMMGHIPGGPAYVIIAACMVFATMASGGLAFIAGFAPIIMPAMLQMGYSKNFAIGLMVTSAALGVLIPPSIPLIVFGFVTETNVKDLYTAAFIPGVLLALLLALTVFIHTRRGHFVPPPPCTWRERWEAFKEAWPAMLMPLIILVPIYSGMCTATEAASIAALYSLFLGTVVYRKLKIKELWGALTQTAHLMGMLSVIISTAFLLNQALVYMRVPFELGDALVDADLHWAVFIGVIVVAYTIMGMFLDTNAMIIITPPILLPALIDLGYDPVAFGVMTVVSVELAIITPPFGMALFVAAGVMDEDIETVTKSCYMFYPAMIAGLFLIALVPDIALLLL